MKWWIVGLVTAAALALGACGDDIQLDRTSLQDLYGTDRRTANCIADDLERIYSDEEIEEIDREVRAIENGEQRVEDASELFRRFDDDLHRAAGACGIDVGVDVDPTTTTTADPDES